MDKLKPSVYIVVPNRNGIKHLSFAIPSLLNTDYSNLNIVVIDDRSTDESVEFMHQNYPSVNVLLNYRKRGFAGAVNTGIEYALSKQADYIAIANNDIKVKPEWVSAVLQLFENPYHRVGLVGFKELGRHQEEEFHKTETSQDLLKLTTTERRVAGCLYICTAKVFQDIGLFDEEYFMYGEDNDFFFCLNEAGYIIMQTMIPVWHYGEGASSGQKLSTTWLAYRNAIRFSIKNESIYYVIRMIISLLNKGCNPILRRNVNDPNYIRLRRFNIVINLFLIGASCFWNLWNIRATLKARRKAHRYKKGVAAATLNSR